MLQNQRIKCMHVFFKLNTCHYTCTCYVFFTYLLFYYANTVLSFVYAQKVVLVVQMISCLPQFLLTYLFYSEFYFSNVYSRRNLIIHVHFMQCSIMKLSLHSYTSSYLFYVCDIDAKETHCKSAHNVLLTVQLQLGCQNLECLLDW